MTAMAETLRLPRVRFLLTGETANISKRHLLDRISNGDITWSDDIKNRCRSIFGSINDVQTKLEDMWLSGSAHATSAQKNLMAYNRRLTILILKDAFPPTQNTPVPNQPPTHSTVSKADLMASLKAHAQVAGRLHELLADAIVAFGFNSWEKINTTSAIDLIECIKITREDGNILGHLPKSAAAGMLTAWKAHVNGRFTVDDPVANPVFYKNIIDGFGIDGRGIPNLAPILIRWFDVVAEDYHVNGTLDEASMKEALTTALGEPTSFTYNNLKNTFVSNHPNPDAAGATKDRDFHRFQLMFSPPSKRKRNQRTDHASTTTAHQNSMAPYPGKVPTGADFSAMFGGGNGSSLREISDAMPHGDGGTGSFNQQSPNPMFGRGMGSPNPFSTNTMFRGRTGHPDQQNTNAMLGIGTRGSDRQNPNASVVGGFQQSDLNQAMVNSLTPHNPMNGFNSNGGFNNGGLFPNFNNNPMRGSMDVTAAGNNGFTQNNMNRPSPQHWTHSQQQQQPQQQSQQQQHHQHHQDQQQRHQFFPPQVTTRTNQGVTTGPTLTVPEGSIKNIGLAGGLPFGHHVLSYSEANSLQMTVQNHHHFQGKFLPPSIIISLILGNFDTIYKYAHTLTQQGYDIIYENYPSLLTLNTKKVFTISKKGKSIISFNESDPAEQANNLIPSIELPPQLSQSGGTLQTMAFQEVFTKLSEILVPLGIFPQSLFTTLISARATFERKILNCAKPSDEYQLYSTDIEMGEGCLQGLSMLCSKLQLLVSANIPKQHINHQAVLDGIDLTHIAKTLLAKKSKRVQMAKIKSSVESMLQASGAGRKNTHNNNNNNNNKADARERRKKQKKQQQQNAHAQQTSAGIQSSDTQQTNAGIQSSDTTRLNNGGSLSRGGSTRSNTTDEHFAVANLRRLQSIITNECPNFYNARREDLFGPKCGYCIVVHGLDTGFECPRNKHSNYRGSILVSPNDVKSSYPTKEDLISAIAPFNVDNSRKRKKQ